MKFQAAEWEEVWAFLRGLGIDLTPFSLSVLARDCDRFLALLEKKNEHLNLTAPLSREAALWKHFADSLAVLCEEPLGVVLDWGSGGGLPGIPLALARRASKNPDPVFFLDSVGKKIRAVEEFSQALGLESGKFFSARGEDLLRRGDLSGVQTVVMRAVAPADRAARWIDPRIPSWLFFLGPQQLDSWKQQSFVLKEKQMQITFTKAFSLPHGFGERILLKVQSCST